MKPKRPLFRSRSFPSQMSFCFGAAKALVKPAVLTGAVLLLGTDFSQAAAITWTGTTSTDFEIGSNWGGTAPVNDLTTDVGTFTGTVTANQPALSANRSIAGLAFTTATGGWTLSGAANTLTIGATGISSTNTSGTNTISAGLILGAAQSWTQATAGTLTASGNLDLGAFKLTVANGAGNNGATIISGNISGTGGSVQIGTTNSTTNLATLTLSGNNTFTGGFTLQSGTININSNTALGTGTLTLATGTSTRMIDNTSASAVTIANAINVQTSFIFTGTNALTITGSIANGSSAKTLTVNGSTLTLSGSTTGTGGITKSGVGTLVLGGGNAYTGATTVNAGVLSFSSFANAGTNSNIGRGDSTTGSTLILNGGTLRYTGTAVSTDRLFSLQSSSSLDSSGTGALNFTNTGNMGFNAGVASKTLTLTGSNTGDNTIAAIIGDNTAATSLVKNGAGKWILSGANTYTGTTHIDAGTLVINGSLAAGSAVTLSTGSTLGGKGTINGLVTANANSTFDLRDGSVGTLTLSGGLVLASGHTIQLEYDLASNTVDKIAGGAITDGTSTTINITELNSGTAAAGTYNLLQFSSGSINASNYTLSNGTVGGQTAVLSATGSSLIMTLGTLGSGSLTAYWKAGASGTWATTNFALNSDGTGTVTGIDGNTDVHFSATTQGAANVASTLPADQSIKSLTIEGTQTGSVSIGGAQKLTIASSGGITSQAGAGALTINTTEVALGSFQIWANNSSNLITVSSNITGTGTGLSLTGSGNFSFGGTNTYDGGTTIGNGSTATNLAITGTGSLLSSGAVTISALSTLDIASHTGNTAIGTLNGSANSNLVLGANTLTINQSASNTFAGLISSTGGGIIKAGTGTLILSAANTYTGATQVNAGILNIQNATALGTTAGGTTVASGAALQLQGTITVGAEALTINGTGITNDGALRNMADNNTFGGAITLGSDARINSFAGTLTLTGGITGAHALTVGGSTGTVVIDSAIGSTVTSLTKDGTGSTLILSQANSSFTGPVTISEGVLQLGNGGITGSLNPASAIVNNGTLRINRTVTTTQGIDFAAIISGSGAFNQAGTGTTILNGSNTYTGATTVNAGSVLNVQNATGLGTTASGTTVASGGALELQGGIAVGTEALSLIGTGISNAGALRSISGNNTYGGTITVGISGARINTDADLLTLTGNFSSSSGSRPLTVGGAGNTTITSSIGTNISTLTKDGTGVLTLTGTNTYTGATTVSAGKLIVNGSLVAASAVTVGSAGTLAGTGTINGSVATTIGGGSKIDLSNGSVGTLTIAGGLTLHGGDILTFDLGNTTLEGADKINLTGGTYNFSDAGTATVNITALGTVSVGDYDIITGISGMTFDATKYTLSSSILGGKSLSLDSSAGTKLVLKITGSFGDNTAYWHAGTTGNWATTNFSTNLDGTGTVGQLGNNTAVYFSSTPSTTTSPTGISTTVDAATTIKSLNVLAAQTGSVTIGGTAVLTITGDGTLTTSALLVEAGAGALTLNGAGISVGGVQKWTNNSSNAVTVSTAISGSALTLTGTGTGGFIFSGANSYLGGTSIEGTKLTLTGAGSLADAGSVNLAANGILDISGITAGSETIGDLTGVSTGSVVLGSKTLVVAATGSGSTAFAGNISGTGDLTKQGTGTLSLSGVNGYTGATTVDAGILALQTGASIVASSGVTVNANGNLDISQSTGQTIKNLSGSGLVSLGAQTLTVNETTDTTFSGVIRDVAIVSATGGGLTKTGTAILTLSGANTYTGTTTVSAGTLNLTGSLASTNVSVASGATLNDTTGGLASTATLTNAGTVLLGANDTITTLNNSGALNGAFTLTATTYNLNGGSVIASNLGTGTLNANGTVALNGTSSATTVNIQTGITTLGSAEKLADTANVTVSSGATLALGGAEKIGALNGGGNVTNGTSLTVDSGTFSGNISGAGSLTKTSSGTLTLSGANTYTGATTVSAGILDIATGASLTSSGYTVASGATLRNTATLTAPVTLNGTLTGVGEIQGLVTANSGSTISLAGDSLISTKVFSGGLTMANGSNINLDISTVGTNDQFALNGSVFSGSGTINLNFTQGSSTQAGSYTLISGAQAGSINESSFTIATLGAGYEGTLTSDGTNLVLTLSTSSFVPYAETPNQIEVAQALEEIAFNPSLYSPDFDNVLDALTGLPTDEFQAALDQISPAFHSGGLQLINAVGQGTAMAVHQNLNHRSLNSVDYSDPYAGDYQWDLWGQAMGYYNDGGTSLVPGQSFESGTFLVGANRNLSHTTSIGIFGGYGDGNADYDNDSSIDLTRQFIGGYLTYVNGGFYANLSAGGGTFDYDSKRRIQFGTIDRTATASAEGTQIFGTVGGGYDFKFGDFRIGPQANLQRSTAKFKSFKEKGADSLNLEVDDTEYTSMQSQLGGRAAYTIQTSSSAMALVPFVQAFWQHEFDDSQEDMNVALDAGNGPSFKYTAEEYDTSSFVVGAGLSIDMGEVFQTVFSYNHDTANGGSDLFSATANFKF
ncbi:MAG: autotransporter-associated beta strand repeat-containing protein [Luteolibacter sp.]